MNAPEREQLEALALNVSAGLLIGMTLPMVERGLPAGTALRLSSALLLVEAFGEEVLHELGISRATFYRWRAALKGFEMPDDPSPEVVAVVERLAAARVAQAAS